MTGCDLFIAVFSFVEMYSCIALRGLPLFAITLEILVTFPTFLGEFPTTEPCYCFLVHGVHWFFCSIYLSCYNNTSICKIIPNMIDCFQIPFGDCFVTFGDKLVRLLTISYLSCLFSSYLNIWSWKLHLLHLHVKTLLNAQLYLNVSNVGWEMTQLAYIEIHLQICISLVFSAAIGK